MKTQLEKINPDVNSSFTLLLNPRLNNLFYWHFHPEFELVYIEGANGTRHVGDHLSQYEYSDLVFIGSNIPHLNFDYGLNTDYEKVVLQLHPSYQEKVFREVPELTSVVELFDRAKYGIAFFGETKEKIGDQLKTFHQKNTFEQFLEALHIFQTLAESNEYILLHEQPYINPTSIKEQERLRQIYRFVNQHFHKKIVVDEVAEMCNLTKAAFCRYFKRATGNTFIHFLNQYRITQAKRLLLMGKNISETCYESGFGSLSYFNRTFKKITGENPSDFKRRL